MNTTGSHEIAELVKVVFTYVIACGVVIGGFVFLFQTRTDSPGTQSSLIVPLVAGFIGMALQFVFSQNTASTTARQIGRAASAASAAASGRARPASPQP